MCDKPNKKHHRWSGWPGAICLDCFCEDPCERCIAEGRDTCIDLGPECPYKDDGKTFQDCTGCPVCGQCGFKVTKDCTHCGRIKI